MFEKKIDITEDLPKMEVNSENTTPSNAEVLDQLVSEMIAEEDKLTDLDIDEKEKPPVEPTLEDLQQTIAAMQRQKEEQDAQMLRLQADFDNYRKRTRNEKEVWRAMILSDTATAIIPVLDNFAHAMRAMENDAAAANHLSGITMIYRQLEAALASCGVQQIEALNCDFDPTWHEAIGNVTVEDEALVGKVVEQLNVGYKIGDKLVRPAMVRIGALA